MTPASTTQPAIEWRTYTPDGRVLIVRQTETGWEADCEGTTGEAETLVDALRGAVVLGGGATPITRSGDPDLQRWIEQTAEHIVGDTRR